MSELGGRRLNRAAMIEILRRGGSVNYHVKRGSRIVSRLEKLPSLAEMVSDGYEDAEAATVAVDQQLAALEAQKAQLTGGKKKAASKSDVGKGGE